RRPSATSTPTRSPSSAARPLPRSRPTTPRRGRRNEAPDDGGRRARADRLRERPERVARLDGPGARENAAGAGAYRGAQALRAVPLRQRRPGRPVLAREDGGRARERAQARGRAEAGPEPPARGPRVVPARHDTDGRPPRERSPEPRPSAGRPDR